MPVTCCGSSNGMALWPSLCCLPLPARFSCLCAAILPSFLHCCLCSTLQHSSCSHPALAPASCLLHLHCHLPHLPSPHRACTIPPAHLRTTAHAPLHLHAHCTALPLRAAARTLQHTLTLSDPPPPPPPPPMGFWTQAAVGGGQAPGCPTRLSFSLPSCSLTCLCCLRPPSAYRNTCLFTQAGSLPPSAGGRRKQRLAEHKRGRGYAVTYMLRATTLAKPLAHTRIICINFLLPCTPSSSTAHTHAPPYPPTPPHHTHYTAPPQYLLHARTAPPPPRHAAPPTRACLPHLPRCPHPPPPHTHTTPHLPPHPTSPPPPPATFCRTPPPPASPHLGGTALSEPVACPI